MAVCARAVTLSRQIAYRRDFAFIDHIVPVREKDTLIALDGLALAELSALVRGELSDLHLALPDILNPDEGYEVGYYGSGLRPGTKLAYPDVDIGDYVQELRNGSFATVADMAALRASHEIRAIVDGETDRAHRRRVDHSFVLEVELDERIFVLFDGSWFQIDRAFHAEVEKDFQTLVAQPFVASTTAKSEREFIAELEANPDLPNLDQVKIRRPGGGESGALRFSVPKLPVHPSQGRSWLGADQPPLEPGVVSAECFVRDSGFRGALRKAVQNRQQKQGRTGFEALLPNQRKRPVPANYTVVFGIMRKRYARGGKLSLPFFSKVSLRSVAARIDSMGFPVEVHLIEKK